MKNAQHLDKTLVIQGAGYINPRQSFEAAHITGLRESIEKIGQIAPIGVKPSKDEEGKFELLFGECRWRAVMESTKVTALYCLIFSRETSPEEAARMQFAENQVRKGVSAVEEGKYLAAYLEFTEGATVKDAAGYFGITESLVRRRVQLATLNEEATMLYNSGTLLISQAEKLAGFSEDVQSRIIERSLFGENGQRFLDKTSFEHSISFFKCDLNRVPFSLKDEDLNPEAGACLSCPKRTQTQGTLFWEAEGGEGYCLDAGCFSVKVKKHYAEVLQWYKNENHTKDIKFVLEKGEEDFMPRPAFKPDVDFLGEEEMPCENCKVGLRPAGKQQYFPQYVCGGQCERKRAIIEKAKTASEEAEKARAKEREEANLARENEKMDALDFLVAQVKEAANSPFYTLGENEPLLLSLVLLDNPAVFPDEAVFVLNAIFDFGLKETFSRKDLGRVLREKLAPGSNLSTAQSAAVMRVIMMLSFCKISPDRVSLEEVNGLTVSDILTELYYGDTEKLPEVFKETEADDTEEE